jgi:hypothetical protein
MAMFSKSTFTCRILFIGLFCLELAMASIATTRNYVDTRPPAAEGATPSLPLDHRLMLYGGPYHRKYLGCLNCSEYATDSVLNPYGAHGTQYAKESIWNHYGEYGSRYSNWSACNPFASDPPIIVNQDGIFYGRLTLNPYHSQIGAGARFFDWLQHTVCER